MFVLLGNVSSAAGFSSGLYDAAYAWVGRLRGGLASASVIACAAFAAVCGSSVATAVTLGKVALPEMKRLGYAPGLSTGAIAAGGTLGFLIPPSTGFVLYAILTEQSIGRLFMAGVVPGLMLTAFFIAVVWILAYFNPTAGPRGRAMSVREKLGTIRRSAPLLGVMVLSIGGIYVGVFTPVEASGVGAALVILLAFATRSLSLSGFWRAIEETLRTSVMLYTIVIGANVLNPFLAVTHIPAVLGEGLQGLGLGAYGSLAVIIFAYIILGMFMDGLAMLVVTIPIVYPIMMSFGFDPIWFGVVAVIVIEMGMISPPVGMNVFVVRGVAGDVPLTTIFKGVMPFLCAMIFALILIIAFPQIALLLPNSMYG
jgi:tripartite ATP-independent transporter DctM subunit